MSNSWEVFANLLSQKDIKLVYSYAAHTAYYDFGTKEITVPQKVLTTEEITQYIVSHEVSHCKYSDYTPQEVSELNIKYPSVFNVVEDAYVEKMIKKDFPGLVGIFRQAGTEMCKDGFFGDLSNVNKLCFLDRLNLNAKIPHMVNPTFSSEESVFVFRMQTLSSKKDVLALTEDIWKFLKKKSKKNKPSEDFQNGSEAKQEEKKISGSQGESEQNSNNKEEKKTSESQNSSEQNLSSEEQNKEESENSEPRGGSEQNSSSEEESKEESENSDLKPSGSRQNEDSSDVRKSTGFSSDGEDVQSEDDVEQEDFAPTDSGEDEESDDEDFEMNAKTIDSINEKMKELYNNSKVGNNDYPSVISMEHAKNKTFSLCDKAAYLKKIVNGLKLSSVNNLLNNARKLSCSADAVFMARKSAKNIRTERNRITGRIDMRKVSNYQTKENIFRNVRISQNEENHGVVILMDYSSSMKNNVDDVVLQTLVMTEFCYKNGIAFEVIAFGARNFNGFPNFSGCAVVTNSSVYCPEAILFLLPSIQRRVHHDHQIHMDNTPTDIALIVASDTIRKYKESGISKTFIFLITDGACTSGGSNVILWDGVRYSLEKSYSGRMSDNMYFRVIMSAIRKRYGTIISVSNILNRSWQDELNIVGRHGCETIGVTSTKRMFTSASTSVETLVVALLCGGTVPQKFDGVLVTNHKNCPWVDQSIVLAEDRNGSETFIRGGTDEDLTEAMRLSGRYVSLMKIFVTQLIERIA